MEGNFRALGLTQDQITEKMKNVTSSFDVLKAKINQPFDESNYQEIIALNNKLQTELAETGNEYTRLHATANFKFANSISCFRYKSHYKCAC